MIKNRPLLSSGVGRRVNSDHVLSRDTDNRSVPLCENASWVTVNVWDCSLHWGRHVDVSQRIIAACSGFVAWQKRTTCSKCVHCRLKGIWKQVILELQGVICQPATQHKWTLQHLSQIGLYSINLPPRSGLRRVTNIFSCSCWPDLTQIRISWDCCSWLSKTAVPSNLNKVSTRLQLPLE